MGRVQVLSFATIGFFFSAHIFWTMAFPAGSKINPPEYCTCYTIWGSQGRSTQVRLAFSFYSSPTLSSLNYAGEENEGEDAIGEELIRPPDHGGKKDGGRESVHQYEDPARDLQNKVTRHIGLGSETEQLVPVMNADFPTCNCDFAMALHASQRQSLNISGQC